MEIHRFIAMRFTRYRSSITVQTLPCDSSFTLSIHRYAFTDVFKQVGWSVEVLPCGEARKVGVRLIYCVCVFLSFTGGVYDFRGESQQRAERL